MASVVLKRTGQKMPLIGFGLWKVTKSTCADTVYNAIKAGYRLLDGAGDYGNEKEAGEGLQRAIKDGLVKRDEIFVTSKLWNTFHAHDHAIMICKKQLADWGLDYFDLYHIHFPIALKYVDPSHRYPPEWFADDGSVQLQNTPMHETWGALEELVDAGLAKNIGLSNCQSVLLQDVFRYARIEPAVLQVELHPYLSQQPLLNVAKAFGMAVTAYSSFGPQSYVELGVSHHSSLLQHELITSIAQKREKTPAQILLRWAIQRGTAVIPKTNNHDRLIANLQAGSFTLSDEEFESINGLNCNLRLNEPPYNVEPRINIFA